VTPQISRTRESPVLFELPEVGIPSASRVSRETKGGGA